MNPALKLILRSRSCNNHKPTVDGSISPINTPRFPINQAELHLNLLQIMRNLLIAPLIAAILVSVSAQDPSAATTVAPAPAPAVSVTSAPPAVAPLAIQAPAAPEHHHSPPKCDDDDHHDHRRPGLIGGLVKGILHPIHRLFH